MKQLLILLTILLLSGCTVQQPQIVEKVKYEWKEKVIKDSVYVDKFRDRYVKGDTVYQNLYVYKYIDRIVVDSFAKIDSIPYPVEVPVEVEREFTEWEKLKMEGFWFLLVIVLAFLGIKIYKFIR